MNTNNKNSALFWSMVLVTGGVFFLLRNFGLLDFKFPLKIFTWRLIPLIIGVNAFLKGKTKEGIIALSIAVIFYIPDFLTTAERAMYFKLWPLLLVAFGGLTLYNFYNPSNPYFGKREPNKNGVEDGNLNESTLMGGTTKKIFSKNFEGGQLNCVMSGSQIDLTEADLAENAGLNVFVLMGGIELKLPKEWNVQIDVLPIMGGVNDQITKFPESVVDRDKKFYLTGNVVMGGIEIKRY